VLQRLAVVEPVYSLLGLVIARRGHGVDADPMSSLAATSSLLKHHTPGAVTLSRDTP
jgi:hypothetical protein